MRILNILNKSKLLIGVILLSLTISTITGCTTVDPYTGQRTASKTAVGTGIGAIGGALLGAAAGGREGAVIGAVAGGAMGAVVGNSMDRQDQELRRVLRGSGIRVVKTRNSIQLIMDSDVTFARGSSDIKHKFYPVLNNVAQVLRHFNRTNIMIYGYTSNTGSAEFNQTLSERRAAMVGSHLISQGIDSRRIFTKGFGQRFPVASNKTKKGRRKNRRVVITLRPIARR